MEQTIPRLELLSAVVLSRLIHSIKEGLSSEMKIDKLFCRTDSKIAWYWIVQSQKEWKPFVQHRVDEIRKLVPEEAGIIIQGLTTQPTYSLGHGLS